MKRLLAALVCAGAATAGAAASLQVGSKRFTESYILGEIVAQTARRAGTPAEHQRGLGNTAILINALRAGSIDLYPEYTGTIAREILELPAVPPLAELNARLAREGLAVAVPLGFNNTYAPALRASDAAAHGVQGRAVMIDLAARFGRARVAVGYDAWMRVPDADGVRAERGDMRCLHTGFPRCCAALPLHEHCLSRLGVHLGEPWHLTPLASWLRAHRRSRFLLTAPPLRLPGAVGSPATRVGTV